MSKYQELNSKGAVFVHFIITFGFTVVKCRITYLYMQIITEVNAEVIEKVNNYQISFSDFAIEATNKSK